MPFFLAPEVKGYWPQHRGVQYKKLMRSQGHKSAVGGESQDETHSEMDDLEGEVKVIPASGSEYKGSDLSPGTTPLEDSVFGSTSVSIVNQWI